MSGLMAPREDPVADAGDEVAGCFDRPEREVQGQAIGLAPHSVKWCKSFRFSTGWYMENLYPDFIAQRDGRVFEGRGEVCFGARCGFEFDGFDQAGPPKGVDWLSVLIVRQRRLIKCKPTAAGRTALASRN